MAQDYARPKRSNARRRSSEPRVPAWVWLFTGCVLGAFIMFLMRLSELDPVQKIASEPKPEKTAETVPEPKTTQPRFDFYELLKETRVTLPDFDSPEAQQTTPEQANEAFEYILQVASFRNEADAEALKVELILLNLDARIEQARVRPGETWNRVLVGPFESRSRLAKVRSTLVANQHEALVLKRPKTPEN